MAKGSSVLLLFAIAVVGQALTPSTYLTTIDKTRLKSVFEAARPYGDAASAHYSILGLKLLGATIPKEQEVCKTVTSSVDTNSVASWFHASTAAKALADCKLSPGGAEKLLTDAITDNAAVTDIYHAFFALKNLGLSVDSKAVVTALNEALKQDDSPLSHSYAFRVAAEVGGDVNKFFDLIEDVIAQADEVDDKYLQFEGGLSVTAAVIDSAYKLAASVKKAPTISQDKVLKFSNYLLSRKHVHQLKSSFYFLSAVKTLTDNKFHLPVAVTLSSSVVVSASEPSVQVRVTDLMGGSLGKLTVTADKAENTADASVVVSKKTLKADAKDTSLYELDFMSNKPTPGFYKLMLSVAPAKEDSRLIGTSGAVVIVKVTTRVTVENVEIGIADRDQTAPAKTTKLTFPNKVKSVLEADSHQKLVMRFVLSDKAGSPFSAHQTFVRLTNLKSKQEIIFVAEVDSSGVNKFDLNVGTSAKDFSHNSGKYSMDLIVGDALLENPISWSMADVELIFPEKAETEQTVDQYAKKPEIKHLFREPEKMPPLTVSTTFSALVILPLLILIVCWFKIGANISNFHFSLSAVGFHVCLAAIFGLYYCYWTYLNMFQTLRYLGILGIPTFIFGNRLLSGIAARRKGEK